MSFEKNLHLSFGNQDIFLERRNVLLEIGELYDEIERLEEYQKNGTLKVDVEQLHHKIENLFTFFLSQELKLQEDMLRAGDHFTMQELQEKRVVLLGKEYALAFIFHKLEEVDPLYAEIFDTQSSMTGILRGLYKQVERDFSLYALKAKKNLPLGKIAVISLKNYVVDVEEDLWVKIVKKIETIITRPLRNTYKPPSI